VVSDTLWKVIGDIFQRMECCGGQGTDCRREVCETPTDRKTSTGLGPLQIVSALAHLPDLLD
jgi:hypothetical protein